MDREIVFAITLLDRRGPTPRVGIAGILDLMSSRLGPGLAGPGRLLVDRDRMTSAEKAKDASVQAFPRPFGMGAFAA